MRKIQKNEELLEFKNWKTKFNKRNKRKAIYDDLHKEPNKIMYKQLKQALYEEQHGICCYCCSILKHPRKGLDESHIEHFKEQAQFSKNTMDYDNMHLSCNGYFKEATTCGHKKRGIKEAILSPLQEECETSYAFLIDGSLKVLDESNEIAKRTITALNLNDRRLSKARARAMENSGVFTKEDNETRDFMVQMYSQPDENNELVSYCDAIVYGLQNF